MAFFSGVTAFIQGNVIDTEGGHICRPCNKFIKTNLGRHVKEIHLERNLNYQCPLCNKLAPNKSALYEHMKRNHSPEHYIGLNYSQCAVPVD